MLDNDKTKNLLDFSLKNINTKEKKIKKQKDNSKSILWEILTRTSSFGIRSLIVAVHYVGNGFIMSKISTAAAAGSTATTTIQSFTIGASSGFLVNMGYELGAALGNKDMQAVSDVTKTGWSICFILGGLSSLVFLSTRYTLPLVLNTETADAAADFFETFAIAAIPDLLIWTNGQVIFQVEKNSFIPLLNTAVYRLSALGLSYYFGKVLGYGPWGVGLGPAITGWGSLILFQPWFFKKIYRDLNLGNPRIKNYFSRLLKFSASGWKHSLQRITEWGNLAIITQIIGAWSNEGLLAEQPSILVLTLCNLLSQGFGQASMMIASNDFAAMNKALRELYDTGNRELLVNAKEFKDRIYKNFFITIGASITFNTAISTGLYFLRYNIINWYVPSDSPNTTVSMAVTLLWINILSLLPDAVRIVSGGVLRGWGDLLAPTLISLIIMSVVGIPVGFGIGLKLNESIIPFFIVRIIALLFASGFNSYRFYSHYQENEVAYQSGVLFGGLLDSLSSYEDMIETSKKIDVQDELADKVNQYGLTIFMHDESQTNLFSIISLALNNEKTPKEIQRITARHIQENINYYKAIVEEDGNTTILDMIKNPTKNTNNVIVSAISRSLKINIFIIRQSNVEPIIIRQKNVDTCIFLGQDNNDAYHLLQGELNESLRLKFEAEPADNFDVISKKQIKNCIWFGIFSNRREKYLDDKVKDPREKIILSINDQGLIENVQHGDVHYFNGKSGEKLPLLKKT